MVSEKKIQLCGGDSDGMEVTVYSYVKTYVAPKKIYFGELSALRIDENSCWRPPEEVYELGDDGKFHFVRSIYYDPDLIKRR